MVVGSQNFQHTVHEKLSYLQSKVMVIYSVLRLEKASPKDLHINIPIYFNTIIASFNKLNTLLPYTQTPQEKTHLHILCFTVDHYKLFIFSIKL